VSGIVKTKIFLDSGDPEETKKIISLLGFLDGQTTNPTLIARNPAAQQRLEAGEKFSSQEIFDFYKSVVTEVSTLIPSGSVSIEVYADQHTTAEEMLIQAKDFYQWIPNAHIKFPITAAGLSAVERAVVDGVRVNMTLCFTQDQAAAVYAATRGAEPGQVFVSPFVGRLDDRGINGMELSKNIVQMYSEGDGHVWVLTSSVRTLDHFLCALQLGSDIITAPFSVLNKWAGGGMPIPDSSYMYPAGDLASIPYQPLNLQQQWQMFNIQHELTKAGIERFSTDWNQLINKP